MNPSDKNISPSSSSTIQNDSSFFSICHLTTPTTSTTPSISTISVASTPTESTPSQKNKCIRCIECNKRLSLSTQFICKCSKILCGKHKYPDMHICSIDPRKQWTEHLIKNNPKIDFDKINKI